jgi:hypothetical protein
MTGASFRSHPEAPATRAARDVARCYLGSSAVIEAARLWRHSSITGARASRFVALISAGSAMLSKDSVSEPAGSVRDPQALIHDLLGALKLPGAPLRVARFGLRAFRSARERSRFRGARPRALLALLVSVPCGSQGL